LRPRRRPKGWISDPRIAGLIAGVANHEARRVYDARVERLRRAHAQEQEAALERQLCDAIRLGIWRARNVTGFEAFAQDVLGVPIERAHTLAERGASQQGVALERLPEVALALWLRAEAALLERCPGGEVELRIQGERMQLSLTLPLVPAARSAEAVAAVGRAASGLARVLAGDPRRREPDKERQS
jgi:hypothetical protein